MKRLLLILPVAFVLSSCGGSSVAYQPAAFGPPGFCYYLYSPSECFGYHSGVPTAMPLYWHQRYAAYYDSPAYINRYVPQQYRRTAFSQSRAFETRYASAIKQQARTGQWKGSNGKTVSGTRVGRSAVYGSGSARSTGFSSGSARGCSALPRKYFVAAIGSSGGGGFSGGGARGGGFSSGSARSGGSSSGSGSSSGGSRGSSRGGC